MLYLLYSHKPKKRISIHALRVEGDEVFAVRFIKDRISIHALRVEGDVIFHCRVQLFGISIHALRVEGDISSTPALRCL